MDQHQRGPESSIIVPTAAQIWRPLLHARDQYSRLYPLPDGNIGELAPAGAGADLITVRKIRF